jgi:hypothetical protein
MIISAGQVLADKTPNLDVDKLVSSEEEGKIKIDSVTGEMSLNGYVEQRFKPIPETFLAWFKENGLATMNRQTFFKDVLNIVPPDTSIYYGAISVSINDPVYSMLPPLTANITPPLTVDIAMIITMLSPSIGIDISLEYSHVSQVTYDSNPFGIVYTGRYSTINNTDIAFRGWTVDAKLNSFSTGERIAGFWNGPAGTVLGTTVETGRPIYCQTVNGAVIQSSANMPLTVDLPCSRFNLFRMDGFLYVEKNGTKVIYPLNFYYNASKYLSATVQDTVDRLLLYGVGVWPDPSTLLRWNITFWYFK